MRFRRGMHAASYAGGFGHRPGASPAGSRLTERRASVSRKARSEPGKRPQVERREACAHRLRAAAPQGVALVTVAPAGAPRPSCLRGNRECRRARAFQKMGQAELGAANSVLPSPLEGEGGERSEPGEGSECSACFDPSPRALHLRCASVARDPLPQGERVSEQVASSRPRG